MGEKFNADKSFDTTPYTIIKEKKLIDINYSELSGKKGMTAEKVKAIAEARIKAEFEQSQKDKNEAATLIGNITLPKTEVSTVTTTPLSHATHAAPSVAPKPTVIVSAPSIATPTVENLKGNYEAQVAHITKMAESVNSSMEIVTDRAMLIKTMLPMGVADGDFGNGATKDSVLTKLKANDKSITGIKQANYSYDKLIEAANDPKSRTDEFNNFLAKMVKSGKIQENTSTTPKYSTTEKGSIILKMAETGSDSIEKNIGFMRHELRHAIMANLDSRNNPKFLKQAETIIQSQSPEWKKKILSFFIGTPYIDRLLDPKNKEIYKTLKQDDDSAKTKFVEDYFSKSENNNKFYISNAKDDRAVALDEFISYTSDKSPSGIQYIPTMKQLLQGEITKAHTTNTNKWKPEQYQALMDELK